jgi:hypothetical protein
LTRTETEFWDALEDQLRFLQRSGLAFDEGDLAEAVRLANTVCILVDDRGRNFVSILSRLCLLDRIPFITTAKPLVHGNLVTEHPLVRIRFRPLGNDAHDIFYVPVFSRGTEPRSLKRVDFAEWWSEPIFRDTERRVLDRKGLTRSLRDHEGGSHLDAELRDPVYRGVAREHSAGWTYCNEPLKPGPHLASMRQVAWELEKTLLEVVEAHRP